VITIKSVGMRLNALRMKYRAIRNHSFPERKLPLEKKQGYLCVTGISKSEKIFLRLKYYTSS